MRRCAWRKIMQWALSLRLNLRSGSWLYFFRN
jgi:hypothetical protein